MGLELLVAREHRLPQLTTVRIPEGIEDAAVRARLLDDYGIEIGAGAGQLAGQIWRIGCMGHTARRRNVLALLGALGEVLDR
jgi:alanine-glyoxylate transaminase/serine-glyoxylate transaminase/serine-pyruvate transaminase